MQESATGRRAKQGKAEGHFRPRFFSYSLEATPSTCSRTSQALVTLAEETTLMASRRADWTAAQTFPWVK